MMQLLINELAGAITQLLILALLPFLWWLVTARRKESVLLWLGLKKINHTGRLQHTALITAAASLAYAVLTGLCVGASTSGVTTAGSQFAGEGMSALPAAIVYAFIRTGLAEEIAFRGFVLKRTADRFGFVAGNMIQSTLFGLLHGLPFGVVSQSLPIALILTILPGAFGYFQGWLNEKRCGGSIVPSWLLHGIMNLLVACFSL